MGAGWAPAPPQPFSGTKKKFFAHRIGVDEKQQHMTKERAHAAKSDAPHSDSSMYFFL